jgi:type II secretory pathway component GspD/PulD (secretin)
LIIEIEKILGIRSMTQSSIGGGGGQAGGQTQQTEEIRRGRSVSVIPGRNILVIRAADDEMDLINEIITRADRPPFQVIIKGLIYTANENKLRDIGIQPTITATTADGRTSGGIRGHTIGGDGTLFDFATIIGTVDFLVQASALQEDGVISIKSRPFATVLDGDTTDLTVGRQVPVLIQAQNAIGGVPGTLQILQAANLLSVTPQVIDDEMGNPMAVNLTLQLESNDVDLSVVSQGVPSVSVRSIQSRFILNQEQTVILGGFTVDSDNRTVSKTPGLGDIPIIGELFKRRVRSSQINRLYFALSVTVVPFPEVTRPVIVPGATTEVPSLTPEMLKRAEQAEPKQVAPQPTRTGP